MENLASAAKRLRNGEYIGKIVLETLSWLGSRAQVDRILFDRLLQICGVLQLIETDYKKGSIQADKQSDEIDKLKRAMLQYLNSDIGASVLKRRNILFISANPMQAIIDDLEDQPLIQAAEEYKDLEEAIRYHQMIEKMPLEGIFEASFTELSERLNIGGIDILHFSNHGDEDGIILNKGDGEKEHVLADQLTGLLKLTKGKNSVKLIFLNSCNSHKLALSLHNAMADMHVISHNRKVPSDLVREFAAYFYRFLAQNFSKSDSKNGYMEAFALAINKYPNLKTVSSILEPKNREI